MNSEPTPPKAPKRLIKSTVTVHDRTQVETVFDYYVNRGAAALVKPKPWSRLGLIHRFWAKPMVRYRVEAYLFYPRQIALDASNYPKDRFFADVRPLVRFREPKLGYKVLMGEKANTRSPLVYLRQYLQDLEQKRETEPVHNAVAEARLFACSFVGALMRGIDRSRKRIAKAKATGAFDQYADNYMRMTRLVHRAEALLSEFRMTATKARNLPRGVGTAVTAELCLVDEYCYYRLRDVLAVMLRLSESIQAQHSAGAAEFRAQVGMVLAKQDEHAQARGYHLISNASTMDQREHFLHRRGELKRRVWGVLFLNLRSGSLFAVQRQIGAMVAAGLAASIYSVIQIGLFVQVLQPKRLHDFWGVSGALFVTAAASAYIVKDRIKEMGRIYFGEGVFRRVPDHSEKIYYRDRDGTRVAVGSLQEAAGFVPVAKIPTEVVEIRRNFASASMGDVSSDHVLVYTKHMSLSGTLKILGRYPLRAVHDILRLNIDTCLSRLGESVRHVDVANEDGTVQTVTMPKVYFLDLALRYYRLDSGREAQAESLDYFRLVLDKTGLVRVERLT